MFLTVPCLSRASLPVRTARLLQRSRTQTPSDVESNGTASPAPTATLLQDVVDIKTLLLQLKRVLQEVSTCRSSAFVTVLSVCQFSSSFGRSFCCYKLCHYSGVMILISTTITVIVRIYWFSQQML